MVRTKYFAAVVAAIITVFATGCIVSFEPETAVNPVGTDHTVRVITEEPDISEDEFLELLCELVEELVPGEEVDCGPEQVATLVEPSSHIQHHFEVLAGPNQGEHADIGDDDVEVVLSENGTATFWTYTSNGVPGRDVIRFCDVSSIRGIETIYLLLLLEFEEFELSEEEFNDVIVEFFNEQFGTEFDSVDEMFCRTVTKTWEEPRRPNIGAGLSGLFAGQPTALPTAPAPAAVAPSQTTIRPPSTGDAGLR